MESCYQGSCEGSSWTSSGEQPQIKVIRETNIKIGKQTRPRTGDKDKSHQLPSVTDQMDPETIMLSEVSQAENDKYHMTSLLTCGV